MIIWIDRPLANDHLDWPASCKWSSRWTGLLQMIIQIDRPLANDHSDGPASLKWSFGWTSLLQMIVWMERPLANGQKSKKRSALFTWSCLHSSWYLFLLILNFLSFSSDKTFLFPFDYQRLKTRHWSSIAYSDQQHIVQNVFWISLLASN